MITITILALLLLVVMTALVVLGGGIILIVLIGTAALILLGAATGSILVPIIGEITMLMWLLKRSRKNKIKIQIKKTEDSD